MSKVKGKYKIKISLTEYALTNLVELVRESSDTGNVNWDNDMKLIEQELIRELDKI